MIVLDIETLDFFGDETIATLPRPLQLAAMRVGLVTMWDTETDEWEQFWPEPGLAPASAIGTFTRPHCLLVLWDRLQNRDIVTFNGWEFDLPLLALKIWKLGIDNPWDEPLRSIDLLYLARKASKHKTGRERWYKLDVLAQANLGRGKSGDGQQAAAWLRSGDETQWLQAAEYCKADCRLTWDLFQKAQGGGLLLPARPERNEQEALRLWLERDGQIRSIEVYWGGHGDEQ